MNQWSKRNETKTKMIDQAMEDCCCQVNSNEDEFEVVVVGTADINISHSTDRPQADLRDNANTNDEMETPMHNRRGLCHTLLGFDGSKAAQGYNILGTGRGPLIMSNIFLSTGLIFLASEEAGCLEEGEDGELLATEICEGRAYGVRPASLITSIAVIAGFLSAALMPLAGAIVDCTPYRWHVGVLSAIALILIQAAQSVLNSSTWFCMSILQAFAWFFFDVQFMCSYAYLPSITAAVTEETMTRYVSIFNSVFFLAEATFLMCVVGVSFLLGWGDVQTARFSQSLNTAVLIVSFYFGWKSMPKVPSSKKLPKDPVTGKQQSIWTHGFVEIWSTAKKINTDHKKGLRWFLLATIFAEAAAEAFAVVAVVYMDKELGMSTVEIGIFFMIGIFALIPGTWLSDAVASRTNPKVSWMMSMMSLQATAIVGALLLNPENVYPGGYIWAVFVGFNLGWFYPAEILFFSMCVPQNGSETELAGFYTYCVVILAWLPPLIFTALVEAGIDQHYGVIAVSGFFSMGVVMLSRAAAWTDILEETRLASLNTTSDNKNGSASDDDAAMSTDSGSDDEI